MVIFTGWGCPTAWRKEIPGVFLMNEPNVYMSTTFLTTHNGHLQVLLKTLARSSPQQPRRQIPSSSASTRSIRTHLQTTKRELCTRQSRLIVNILTRVRHDRPRTPRNNRFLDRAPASILQESDIELLKVCHIASLRGQLIRRTTTCDDHSNAFLIALSRHFFNLPARGVRVAE